MTRYLLLLLTTLSVLTASASTDVQVTDSDAFFPQLNHEGTKLLYGPTDGSQLLLKDLTTGQVTVVNAEGHAGFNAIWGQDGKVYYVTQEQRKNRLIYRTGHQYDPATGRDRVVLKAQHGAVKAVRGTKGVAIVGEHKSWNLKKAGTTTWTLGNVLYISQRGKTSALTPIPLRHTAGFLWPSLSPDGSKVAFVAASKGLVVCDLSGNILKEYGLFLMPSWLTDSHLVAMSNSDNIRYSASNLWLITADGDSVVNLTPNQNRCIQPMVANGRVAYTTPAGTARILTPDSLPSSKPLPATTTSLLVYGIAPKLKQAPRVFINPGHGGHDDDDRFEPFFNQAAQDTVPYYESDSNLGIGLALQGYLNEKGYQVFISRTGNATEDDLNLFEIRSLAEDCGADLFYCIHSNDTGTPTRTNFPLAIYRGYTGQPLAQGSDSLAAYTMRHLYANQATCFKREPMISGDWTFYEQMWGPKVGLGVLRYNTLPGLLSEGCFHDYLPERERLINQDYLGLEGWNHSLAIDDYFGRSKKYDLGMIAGLVRSTELRTDTATITIGDDRYQPLSNIHVKLLDAKGKVINTFVTDNFNNGFYGFYKLKLGTYTVAVGTETKEVRVERNQVTYCNFMINQ